MASQPPPTPAPQPVPPKKGGCLGRGCGFGCGRCLVGGPFVVQASAAVTAPATLVVINQPITVDGKPATAGESLNAGNTVATGATAHGAIDFPDGSFMRLAPQTSIQVTSVKLQTNGNLQAIELQQKVGRTLTNVQHLANGASFK